MAYTLLPIMHSHATLPAKEGCPSKLIQTNLMDIRNCF